MSITLSVPPAIIQEVRAWADANGTSLNEYIRECLKAKVDECQAERRKRADGFRAFASSHVIHVPRGWRFDRARETERESSSLTV